MIFKFSRTWLQVTSPVSCHNATHPHSFRVCQNIRKFSLSGPESVTLLIMLNEDFNRIEIFSFLFSLSMKSQTVSRCFLSCFKALLKVGSFYSRRHSDPILLIRSWTWGERGASLSWVPVGDDSSQGKRAFWHPLYFFSGSTERVSINFILLYLGDKGVVGLPKFWSMY